MCVLTFDGLAKIRLRIELPPKSTKSPDTNSEHTVETEKEPLLLCATCSNIVTSRNQAIKINGSHEHAFFNPSGIAYEVGCFSRAPGVFTEGDPTFEFSWFDGFAWKTGRCTACLNHLGWFFTNTDNSFFGLIKTKLI